MMLLLERTGNYDGRVKIENVPPSEFLISRESKTIQDARFVCHRVKKTLSELREMYPDESLDVEDLTGGDEDMGHLFGESQARYMILITAITSALTDNVSSEDALKGILVA